MDSKDKQRGRNGNAFESMGWFVYGLALQS